MCFGGFSRFFSESIVILVDDKYILEVKIYRFNLVLWNLLESGNIVGKCNTFVINGLRKYFDIYIVEIEVVIGKLF